MKNCLGCFFSTLFVTLTSFLFFLFFHSWLGPIAACTTPCSQLLVLQSQSEQLLHGSLAWGSGWQGLDNPKTPTQFLLIQQPAVAVPSSSSALSPSGGASPQLRKGGNRCRQNRSSKTSYLPILNSYPRIAPHPGKNSYEGKGASVVEGVKEGGSEGQHQSKRACIEGQKREAVSTTTTALPKAQQHHKVKGRSRDSFSSLLHHSLPSHSSAPSQHKHQHHQHQPRSSSHSVGSPSVSSSQTPSPPSSSNSPSSSSPPSSSPSSSISHSPQCPAPDSSSTRHRRFRNTAEILNQSGLLAIALRTKELLKQNVATDREIAQLHQHTHLLCQVVQGSQKKWNQGSYSLDQLLQTMAESGCYPKLDLTQVKVLSSDSKQNKSISEEDNSLKLTETRSSPTQVVSLHSTDDGIAPPSPLFAPSPDTEEHERGDSFPGTVSIPVTYSTCVPEHLKELKAFLESWVCSNRVLFPGEPTSAHHWEENLWRSFTISLNHVTVRQWICGVNIVDYEYFWYFWLCEQSLSESHWLSPLEIQHVENTDWSFQQMTSQRKILSKVKNTENIETQRLPNAEARKYSVPN